MKPQKFTNIQSVAEDEDKWRYTSVQLKSLTDILNKAITFQDNFRCAIINATFTTVNTDTGFSHNLGFVPLGYLPITYTSAFSVYNGTTTWTGDEITLKANSTGMVKLIVF